MGAGGDAALKAGVADLLVGGDELGVGEFAGDAERNTQVGRANHHDIDAGDVEEFVDTVERGFGFNLQDHHRFLVVVLDGGGDGDGSVIVIDGGEAVAADAGWWEFGPGDGLGEELRRFDAREDDTGSADVEGPGDQGVLQIGDADERGEVDVGGDAAEILDGFEVEATVLTVNEGPVEAGGGEELEYFLRAELAEAAAILALPCFESFFEDVFAESHGLLEL